ncbi:MAG: hypothetical protein QE271_11205 [Bacteriovoracaceae bacterium]|nr:hypothetical protein [Bacteriovoracaceae bacterium]
MTPVSAKKSTKNANAKQHNVLFQKLGNTWYVFSDLDNEIIYSAMPEGMDPRTTKLELYEIIEEHLDNLRRRSPAKSNENAA